MYRVQTNSSIIQTHAREWIGTKWKHQGRNHNGIDCAGLIILVAKEIGVVPEDFDEKNYPRRSPHSQEFLQYFKDRLPQKKNNEKKPGDVVILKEPVYPCHCGILAEREGQLTLIHAHAPRKKVLEEFWHQGDWPSLHVATFSLSEAEPWHS